MPTKVLLTGASGFLGWNFSKFYQDQYDITGIYFRQQPKDLTIRWQKLNLLETKTVRKVIEDAAPDIIVHLAAISDPNYCENHPALSHHINVYTTLEIAKAAATLNIPMIFSSTDLVFNGSSGEYTESDFCYPLSQYGTQKQQAEETLLSDFEQSYILRLPLMFGWTPDYTSNFFTKSIADLQNGETVQAFTDEYRSMLSAEVASTWIALMIDRLLLPSTQTQRLMHTAAAKKYTRYEFMKQLASVFELDSNLLQPCLQKELNLVPQRPSDVSLDISLAQGILGFTPPSLLQQLIQLKANYLKI